MKESVLAVEVLGRSAGFDPKTDPIARVEVSRLRSRLEMFHPSEGGDSVVRITLPNGTYIPVFETVERLVPVVQPRPLNERRTSRRYLFPAIAVAAASFLGVPALWMEKAPDTVSSRFSILPPPGTNIQSIAISPDGRSNRICSGCSGNHPIVFPPPGFLQRPPGAEYRNRIVPFLVAGWKVGRVLYPRKVEGSRLGRRPRKNPLRRPAGNESPLLTPDNIYLKPSRI